jgi:hypothetical protein
MIGLGGSSSMMAARGCRALGLELSTTRATTSTNAGRLSRSLPSTRGD